MTSQKRTNKLNHSFVSYRQLSLAKWPQFGPQPHRKIQPFLLADQTANRNSKWRCAMQPQRNLRAWKILKLKPISTHNHVAVLSNQPALLNNLKNSHLVNSRVGYFSFHPALRIFRVIWTEYFTARWYRTLRKYMAYLQFGSHLFLCMQQVGFRSPDTGQKTQKCHVHMYTQGRPKPSAGYSTSKWTFFKFRIHKNYALLS